MNLSTALNLCAFPRPQVITFTGAGGKTTAIFRLGRELALAGQRVITTSTTQMPASKLALAPAYVTARGNELPLAALAQALDEHTQCLLIGPLAETERGLKATAVAPELVDRLAAKAADLGITTIAVEGDGARVRSLKAPAAHEPVVPTSTTVLVPMMGLDAIGRRLDETMVHRPELVRARLALPVTGDVRITPHLVARLLVHPLGGAKGQPAGAQLLPMLNKTDTPLRLAMGRIVAHQLSQRAHQTILATLGVDEGEPIIERWGPTCAVVIAAGASRRMGRPKQLEVVDGEAMVVRALHVALQSEAARVIVVTGAYSEQVAAALQPHITESHGRAELVYNAFWESGQASSVRAAVQALPNSTAAVSILPVDQPFLTPALLRRLTKLWRHGARIGAPLVDGVLRGAPAIFDIGLRPELLALEGDVGARPLLQKYRQDVVSIPVSPSLVRDFDTPADLEIP